jgi:hypothetical protein
MEDDMRSLINNLKIYYLIVPVLFAAQLSMNAQGTTQRTEPGDTSLLLSTGKDIKNAIDLPTAPPPNDMFANAQVIAATNAFVSGTNVDATLEPEEPNGSVTQKTVWYRWNAQSNLSMTFQTTSGTLSDTVLAVYVGSTSINSLTMIASNDDINGSHNRGSRVTFIATAGTRYNIQVGGYGSSSGTFGLRWTINGAESWKQFNFDGNQGSDLGIFRPSTGVWWIWGRQNAVTISHQWGSPMII